MYVVYTSTKDHFNYRATHNQVDRGKHEEDTGGIRFWKTGSSSKRSKFDVRIYGGGGGGVAPLCVWPCNLLRLYILQSSQLEDSEKRS